MSNLTHNVSHGRSRTHNYPEYVGQKHGRLQTHGETGAQHIRLPLQQIRNHLNPLVISYRVLIME